MYEIVCFLSVSFIVGLILHWLFYYLNVFVGIASLPNGRGILIMSMFSMSLFLLLLMCIDWISPMRQMADYRMWIKVSFLLAILFLILSKDEMLFGWTDYVFNFLIAHVLSLSFLAIVKLALKIL